MRIGRRTSWRWALWAAALAGACAQSTPSTLDAVDARDVAETVDDGAVDDAGPDTGCPPGRTLCGTTCVDTTTDPEHCGSCGDACAPGEVCNEGSCASGCSPGLTNCAGSCVDLSSDEAHCGACRDACGPHEECRSGVCVCVPDCIGRECGDDGCGGSCGDCDPGRECGADGRCFCAGNCVGRTCGDDGCGGSCGDCDPGFDCTPDGACVCSGTPCGGACCGAAESCLGGACCSPTWRTDVPGATLQAIARDGDGTLYVAGGMGTQAYVAAFDACGGGLREGRFSIGGAATTAAVAAAIVGADLYVAGQTTTTGTDPGSGMWARLPKTTLSPSWSTALFGTPDATDEVWAVGMTAGGDGWMVGTSNASGTPTRTWLIRGRTTGAACGTRMFPDAASAAGRDSAFAGGRVWFAGAYESEAYVTSYLDTDCDWTGTPCLCPSSGEVTFAAAGAAYTEARGLVVFGSTAYVAGFADVGGDYGAMVARVTGTTATFAPRWNPTAQFDGFVELAADASGAALYATGASDWPGTGESGRGVVARYGAAGLTAEWQAYPTGTWVCWDAVVDDDGGIVAVCGVPTGNAVVVRCLATGVCG